MAPRGSKIAIELEKLISDPLNTSPVCYGVEDRRNIGAVGVRIAGCRFIYQGSKCQLPVSKE